MKPHPYRCSLFPALRSFLPGLLLWSISLWFAPAAQADQCEDDADCADADTCTLDFCSEGLCSQVPIVDCPPSAPGAVTPGTGGSTPMVDTPPLDVGGLFDGDPPVAVLETGYAADTTALLNGLGIASETVSVSFDPAMIDLLPVMVIPSAGLLGLAGLPSFQARLEDYVSQGGGLVVLAQQQGEDLSVVPGGVAGKGWNESWNLAVDSVYLRSYHPMVGALQSVTGDVNLDGYLTDWPDSATILFDRTDTGAPVSLLFPHGNGWVLVTSFFPDWAYTHGEATDLDLALFRDAVRWMKAGPGLPEAAPGETVTLEFQVQAVPQATVMPWRVLDPEGTTQDAGTLDVDLSSGPPPILRMEVPIPADAPTGIWRLVYTLLDSGGTPLIPDTHGEWFAVGEAPDGVLLEDTGITFQVEGDGDIYFYGEYAQFHVEVYNDGGEDATVSCWYSFPESYARYHSYYYGSPGTAEPGHVSNQWRRLVVPAGSVGGFDYSVPVRVPLDRMWVECYQELSIGEIYLGRESAPFQGIDPVVTLDAALDRDDRTYFDGLPVRFDITVGNPTSRGETPEILIDLVDPDGQYLGTLRQAVTVESGEEATLLPRPTYYLPPDPRLGQYRCDVKVYLAGNLEVTRYLYFHVIGPKAAVSMTFESTDYLAGRASVTIANQGPAFERGMLTAVLTSPTGDSTVKQALVSIPDIWGEVELPLDFAVPGLVAGTYRLDYTFTIGDFTTGGTVGTSTSQGLPSDYFVQARLDAYSYSVVDEATITVSASNDGVFHMEGSYDVSIPDFGFQASEDTALAPGESTSGVHTVEIPDDMDEGYHVGTVRLLDRSGEVLDSHTFSIYIPAYDLSLDVPLGTFTTGDVLTSTIANADGPVAHLDCATALLSSDGVTRATGENALDVFPEASGTVELVVPDQLVDGSYRVSTTCEDRQKGEQVLHRTTRITLTGGVAAHVTIVTDKTHYKWDETLTATSTITNDGVEVPDANLHLDVYRRSTEGWLVRTWPRSGVGAYVKDIASSPDGTLWMVPDTGIVRFDPLSETWETFTTQDGLLGTEYNAIAVDSVGGVYVGGSSGVEYRTPNGEWTTVWSAYDWFDEVIAVGVDAMGSLWFSTWYDLYTVYWIIDGPPPRERLALPRRNARTVDGGQSIEGDEFVSMGFGATSMDFDAAGNCWFGTEFGAARYSIQDGYWTYYYESPLPPYATDVAVDDDGSVWFASSMGVIRHCPVENGGGWDLWRPVPPEGSPIEYGDTRCADGVEWVYYTMEDGLISEDVQSLMVDGWGDRWFGTSQGLSRFSSDGVWTSFTTADGLGSNDIISMADDIYGNRWFGSPDAGLTGFLTELGETRTYNTGNEGPASNLIVDVFPAFDGTKWFGTGSGASRLNAEESEWANWTEADGLPASEIRAVARDHAGYTWFGTTRGVARLDPDGTLRQLSLEELAGLPGDYINDIAVDSEGNIWFATDMGIGLLRADGTWDMDMAEGPFYDEEVMAIDFDDDGNAWVLLYYVLGRIGSDYRVDRYYPPWSPYGRDFWDVSVDEAGDPWLSNGYWLLRLDPDSGTWWGYSPWNLCDCYADGSGSGSGSGSGAGGPTCGDLLPPPSDVGSGGYSKPAAGDDPIGWGSGSGSGSGWWGSGSGSGSGGEGCVYWVDDQFTGIGAGKNGLVWAGGISSGLWIFDSTTETWTNLTMAEDGLGSDEVLAVEVAEDGAAWVGTTGGVSKVIALGSGIIKVDERDIPIPLLETSGLVDESVLGPYSDAGTYYIDATLTTGKDQVISDDATTTFHVMRQGQLVALSLTLDRVAYRPDEEAVIEGEVVNVSEYPLRGIPMALERDGVTLLSESLDLDPGDAYAFSTTTPAGEPFSLVLTADVERTSKEVPVSSADEDLVSTITVPDVVGRTPFTVDVVLENTGLRDISLDVALDGVPETSQSLVLGPGTTETVSLETLVTGDDRVTVVLGGDVERTLEADVRFGEDALVDVSAEEVYREGWVTIPFQVISTGEVAETLDLAFTLTGIDPETGLPDPDRFETSTEAAYWLEPDDQLSDQVTFELEAGRYQLEYQCLYDSGTVTFQVLPSLEISVLVEAGSFDSDLQAIPVTVTAINTGYDYFEGALALESDFYDDESSLVLDARGGEQVVSTNLPTAGAEAGEHVVTVRAHRSGEVVASDETTVLVPSPTFIIDEKPADNQTFAPGDVQTLAFTIANLGPMGGTATLRVRALETLDGTERAYLDMGEKAELSYMLGVPEDQPAGDYALEYQLGDVRGRIPFHVAGLDVDAVATLDQPVYAPGEPVQLTLTVTNTGELPLSLVARASLAGGDEQRTAFDLDVGATSAQILSFPSAGELSEWLAYAIYLQSGRPLVESGITVPVRTTDLVLYTDATTYDPGAQVTVTVEAGPTGALHVEAPGLTRDFTLDGETLQFSFDLPADIVAGSYGIDYVYDGASGRYPFDVRGHRVVVEDLWFDQEVYEPEDLMGVGFELDSALDTPVRLVIWVQDPPGDFWMALERDTDLHAGWQTLPVSVPLSSSTTGTHVLRYGFYLAGTGDTLATGSAWFDVSDGILHVDAAATAQPEDGSRDRPFTDPGLAARVARDGDHIQVAAGDYPGGIEVTRDVRITGGYDPDTWEQPEGGAPTVLRPDRGDPGVRVLDRAHVTLEDLSIEGGDEGVVVENADAEIARLVVTGADGPGVRCSGDGTLSLASSFLRANGVGVRAEDGCDSAIVQNTIVDQEDAGISVSGVDAVVDGNIVVDNGKGIEALDPDTFVDVTYNDVWNNPGGDYDGLGDPTGEDGNVSVDPKLYEPDDPHLGYDSPLIDAGPDDPTSEKDTDREARPDESGAPADIGADEYVDADRDGMPDYWERRYFKSTDPDGTGDPDGDDIPDRLEYLSHLNPLVADPPEDSDGDGYNRGADCDDSDAAVHPGAPELCNGADDDCDGQVDEAEDLDPTSNPTWYLDADGDGFGNPSVTTADCTAPDGYVADGTDCDDSDPAVNPGAVERFDGIDNDCDGVIDPWFEATPTLEPTPTWVTPTPAGFPTATPVPGPTPTPRPGVTETPWPFATQTPEVTGTPWTPETWATETPGPWATETPALEATSTPGPTATPGDVGGDDDATCVRPTYPPEDDLGGRCGCYVGEAPPTGNVSPWAMLAAAFGWTLWRRRGGNGPDEPGHGRNGNGTSRGGCGGRRMQSNGDRRRRNHQKRSRRFLLLGLIPWLMIGCDGRSFVGDESPTPTPTCIPPGTRPPDTPAATATPGPMATPTPGVTAPTATPPATPTPGPVATPTVAPTPVPATPTPGPGATPTPWPAATPTPSLCTNGVQDEGEEGIDCGGACEEQCPPPDPAESAPEPADGEIPTFEDSFGFLFLADDPIQVGVDADAMEPHRLAVIRGLVTDRDENPIRNVTVTVAGHPEFGETRTRDDGMFDMAVNGGGLLTVQYHKDGYLDAQRTLDVPWNDIVSAPHVVLVALDPIVTTVTLGAGDIQVARGSTVVDDDGPRKATLLFPAGLQATMVLDDGTEVPLNEINVRATEYTVGENGQEAMPAPLPTTSGYTYAVELSVDEALEAGADEVQFSEPVAFYVDNFLGFPVGETVPVGYLDRDRNVWVPSENGLVIEVLDIQNGQALLDIDGDGIADSDSELAAIEITTAELEQLASLYQPGTTLWRARIPHFSPWDCNWPFGPPPGKPYPPPKPPKKKDPNDDPCQQGGSIILCQSQVLAEELPVSGTPFKLHYQTNWQRGFNADQLVIPLTDDEVPEDMKRIELSVEVAGDTRSWTYEPAPNLLQMYTWNGLDAYGRPLPGNGVARVILEFIFPAVYYSSNDFSASFARFPERDYRILRGTRMEIKIRRAYSVPINRRNIPIVEFGGWSLDVHHLYQPTRGMLAGTLFQGDGMERAVDALGATIETVAGGGNSNTDGLSPTSVYLVRPGALAVDAAGAVFVVEKQAYRIRKFTPGDIIETVVGTGVLGVPEEGRLAVESPVGTVEDIALGPDGALYFANYSSGTGCAVYRVGEDGRIERVAGTGECHPETPTEWQEGDLARDVALVDIQALAVGPDGTLYLARPLQVLTVDPLGRLFVVAGNGQIPDTTPPDGEPAATSALYVDDIDVASDGTLYFESMGAVRTIDSVGRLETVAGVSGVISYPENGADALSSSIPASALVVGPNREIYCIFDENRPLVYKVDAYGTIKYVAGGLEHGFSGDNGLAIKARFKQPLDLAFGPDGSLYVSDTGNHRVRRISPGQAALLDEEVAFPSADGSLLYTFDTKGRHMRTLNAVTMVPVYEFGYDDAGRLIEIVDQDGNVTTIERDEEGVPVAFVAPGGQRTEMTWNDDGYLASMTNPAEETTSLTYYDGGLLETLTDARGNVHRFQYDAVGRLTYDEGPTGESSTLERTDLSTGYQVDVRSTLGRTTSYTVTYSPDGTVVTRVTSPSGAVTQSRKSPGGILETTYPDGSVVASESEPDPRWGTKAPIAGNITITEPSGLVTSVETSREVVLAADSDLTSVLEQTDTVFINGRPHTTIYDARTGTLTRITPEGRQIVATLDAADHVVLLESDGMAPISFVYDETGLLLQNILGDLTWSYTYDSARNRVAVLGPSGRSVQYAYDPVGRVIRTTTAGGSVYEFTYDENGNLVAITTPAGTTHRLDYTAADDRALYLPPGDPAGYAWSYDQDGALVAGELPDGRVVQRTYDTAGRLSGIAYQEAAIAYTFHEGSDLLDTVSRTSAEGTLDQSIAHTWETSRLRSMSWTGTAEGTYTYAYDDNRWLSEVGFASEGDEMVVAREHDDDGLLVGVGPFAVERDGPLGTVSRIADGVSSLDLHYDTLGRSMGLTQAVNGDVTYAYEVEFDGDGRIVQKTETIGGATVTSRYTYDGDGQLLEVERDGEVIESYAYDANGNRTYAFSGGVERNATYDTSDVLLQVGDETYTHDDAGFLVQKGDMTLTYSTRGELLRATLPSGETVEYVYDGFMRRVARIDATGVEHYFYGDPNRLDRITHIRHQDGTLSTLYYGPAGRLYAIQRSGATYYVATDQVGTLRLVVDSSGQVVKRVDYDSWGVVLSETGDFDFPFGFAGGLQDPATGLVHMTWRDYDPESGRWTSRDPSLFSGGQVNVYIYVSNNPINLWDPAGLFAISISGYAGIGGGVKVSWVPGQGFSTCFELGVGSGVGASVDPTGGVDPSDISVVGEIGYSMGPLGISVEAKIGQRCGPSGKVKVGVGPVTIDSSGGTSVGGSMDDMGKTIPEIMNGPVEGKVGGKFAVEVCKRWW